MAGKILIDVISTNNKGLIGITEDGEEVALSAPIPKAVISNVNVIDEVQIKQKIIGRHKRFYIQIGKSNYINQCIGIAYNVYTRRK